MNKKILLFNYNISEIGSLYMLDGFLRKTNLIENKKIISVRFGDKKINEFTHNLVLKIFKKYEVNIIKNKLVNFTFSSIFFKKNKFTKYSYLISNKKFNKLKSIDWLEENRKILKEKLYNDLKISNDSWYVCFFSRDSSFDSINRKELASPFNIRNSDIDNFLPAMEFITKKGGYSIRIGNIQNKKIEIQNNKIIDYPFTEFKSEKNDFLLSFFPKFIIGCGSGIVDLSSLNDIPVGIVNCAEYEYHQNRKNVTFIPKLIRKKSNNEILKYDEYFDLIKNPKTITDLNDYINKNDLYYEENKADDILEITKSFYSKFIENKQVNELRNENFFGENGVNIYDPYYKRYLRD